MYVALVKEVKEANLNSGGGRRRAEVQHQDEATSLVRKYNNMVLGGKVCAAVRMATNRGAGRPYRPHDLDSKSGHPVINVLRDTHPDCHVPLVSCYEECIAKAAACLSGSTGTCRIEAEMLKHWLLRYGAHLGHL
jgi:hypothetical protein